MDNETKKVKVLEVEEPELKKNTGRLVGNIIGFAFVGIGILFILSIVMIIPGIFSILVGMFTVVACSLKGDVECPACGTVNKVKLNSKKIECEACATITPIKWYKNESDQGNKMLSWKAWRRNK